jgi:hypothetical protein
MAHGGKRKGAGRKPGVRNKKTKKVLERIEAEGITPLDCMLKAMRERASLGDWTGAADIAKMAAPYVHPKLQAIEHIGKNGEALIPKRLEIVFVKSDSGSN